MKLLKTLIATFIAFNTTSAWADLRKGIGYEVCSPVIHFKLPSNWANAYQSYMPRQRLHDQFRHH